MKVGRFVSAIAGALLWSSLALGSQAAGGTSVTLRGTLNIGEFFGPPNYGENPESDSIERSYFVQLQIPINIKNRDGGYFVQLVTSKQNRENVKALVGKYVELTGEPMEANTGHHRTPFLIIVGDIRSVSDARH